MIRTVELPEGVAGHLFLHSMPGRYETYEDASREIARHQIACVVCLAPFEEVKAKAPEYGRAIEAHHLLWEQEMFPVPDYGVPGDHDAFWRLAQRLARRLQTGERILIHCGAGIGRTGTLAICVLLALGCPLAQARAAVQGAGSSPETPAQQQVVARAPPKAVQERHSCEPTYTPQGTTKSGQDIAKFGKPWKCHAVYGWQHPQPNKRMHRSGNTSVGSLRSAT